jgi:RNA polymerase sigma-70 factor (ECF subfamily)
MLTPIIDGICRAEGPRLLAGLIRRVGDFELAEDAMQDAFAKALEVWPAQGLPAAPAAWLTTVARRRAIDLLRRRAAGPLYSDEPPDMAAPEADDAARADAESWPVEDDRLRLVFTCCHPAIAQPAQMALALRTLCGLSTREIARAFLEPEATTAQRLVRAKRKILDARIPFEVPARELLPERLSTVLGVVYLVFNEGYASTEADGLVRTDLCSEAIRLGRLLVELLPEEPEAQGLLALMLLHDARRATRIDAAGALVPLEEQDRGRWQRDAIAEGLATLQAALAGVAAGLPAAGGDRRAPRRGRACASHRLGADRGALRRPAARAAEPRGRAQRGRGPGDGARPGAGPVLDRSPRPGRSARRLSPPAGRPRGLCCEGSGASPKPLSPIGRPSPGQQPRGAPLSRAPAGRLHRRQRVRPSPCGKAPDCGLPQGCKARLGPE